MTRNFSELEAKLSPERRARINARVQETLAEMERQEQLGNRADTVHLTEEGDTGYYDVDSSAE